ncbi:MAG: hypothetical protein QW323_00715 [Candidatus Bathyarchaeia archaeon]
MSLLKRYPKAYFEILASSFMLMINMSLVSAFLPIFAYELDPSGVMVGLVSSVWFFSRVFWRSRREFYPTLWVGASF